MIVMAGLVPPSTTFFLVDASYPSPSFRARCGTK
jgi:hypothetical protein